MSAAPRVGLSAPRENGFILEPPLRAKQMIPAMTRPMPMAIFAIAP